jgi:hypothetical protein
MTIKDNRKQPMKIQPRTSSKAVTDQVATNTARGIVLVNDTVEEAPQKRYLTQGDPPGEPLGIAPVDRGD